MTSESSTEVRVRPRRNRRKLNSPINLALAAILLAGLAFWLGSRTGSDAAAEASSPFPARAGVPGGAEVAGSPAGGPEAVAESGTSGEVTSLSGNVLYVETSDGNTVKVKVSDGATVTRMGEVEAKNIHPGDTVSVDGSTSKSGVVSADSVTAIQSGVSGGARGPG
ncbi:MAG: hypothetical protein WBW62_11650 [Solirubrobacterales bacterium]